ncbi:hypothetical protein NIES2119_03330 [[Phormidium ambiguum] IAM M-71]|uniref:DUF3606 domain-containing protein n=1 Tax=[Phormidium ambiguum] IAM M-71 TaxID=454136 RepID=A0A1U7IS56_9CYAN|nr:DUF3606 domain-containing protein [Phormidium ambiguum]OKH40225.1 hypothetical protein NIES2119_03330 [Phormidium ambiguum IAM M-71]
MPDNLKRPRPEDRIKININQEYEVGFWMQYLGISDKDLLERAVRAVGPLVTDVRKWLRKNGY